MTGNYCVKFSIGPPNDRHSRPAQTSRLGQAFRYHRTEIKFASFLKRHARPASDAQLTLDPVFEERFVAFPQAPELPEQCAERTDGLGGHEARIKTRYRDNIVADTLRERLAVDFELERNAVD